MVLSGVSVRAARTRTEAARNNALDASRSAESLCDSVYPSCSTLTFEFFMREAFDGPGEDGLEVMRADRGVEIGSSLYSMFGTPYALAMMVIYPMG